MQPVSSPRSKDYIGPELAELGLWLRIGFVGLAGAAAGLAQLMDGLAQPRSTLALMTGGILVAGFSYWRSRALLAKLDASAENTSLNFASRPDRRDLRGAASAPSAAA